ncbi:PTS mannose transporter subunit IIAB [uncultured Cardiobacterium sp.]|uniref:PTS mannose transporter subunit IIAB n=1 Tax=uncultured Cardiobacterium sp. TaxID=417619 RepID=UPI00261F919B|nr:PTS mannose transporter subunit IIAB [uncultured Cardiobacterium sp.]
MTIAVVITTHGHAAKALLATAEMIIGEQDNVRCVDFVPGENGEVLAGKIRAAAAELDTSAGLLLLVDLWGGTPFNASSGIAHDDANTEVVTGVNIPMLVSVLMEREDITALPELTALAQREGADGVKSLKTQAAAKAAPAAASSAAPAAAASQETFDENDPEVQRLRAEASAKVNDGPHMSFGLWRIDDRLIHGQVATRWTKETGVKRIIVVNDNVVKDKTRATMLKQAVPPGVTAHVVSVDKMMRVYNNPEYAGDKVMLLFTNPTDALELVRRGVPIKSINIGGMAYKEGRVMLDMSVSVDEKDIEAFKELDSRGIELEVRKVASDKKVPVLQLIAEKYKPAN